MPHPEADPGGATPDLPAERMAELIRSAPPDRWPHGWAEWENVRRAHLLLAAEFLDGLGPCPPHLRGRCVTIPGGGPRYFTNAWVCINVLRELCCKLPIQLWHLGPAELDPAMRRSVTRLGVECVDAYEVARAHPCRVLRGWELKTFMLKHCPYREVLLLDADNVPTRDPTDLFDHPRYREIGSVFWPDFHYPGSENVCHFLGPAVWAAFGLEFRDEPPFESGQLLVDRTRCWRALSLAAWYGDHSDWTFRQVWGDKDCFHMAWRRCGTEYALPPTGPVFLGHTIYQHDFEGRRLFQHRCSDKWRLDGRNQRHPAFEHEERCLEFLAELRATWDGILWRNPRPTSAERLAIRALTGQQFTYRRCGYDERTVELAPGGRIGLGAAEREYRWEVHIERGAQVLSLCSAQTATCRLRRDPDGVWRGDWLEFERMPVEFVPLPSRAVRPDRDGPAPDPIPPSGPPRGGRSHRPLIPIKKEPVMRVSVVLASLNEGDLLWKTVQSTLETTTDLDCEVVVADDASTDGSVDELRRRFPGVRVVRSPERKGCSPTKDLAARASRGRTIVFLDAHCKPEPGSIERLVRDVEYFDGQAIVSPRVPALDVARWRNNPNQVGHGYRMDLQAFDCGWVGLGDMRVHRTGGRDRFYESATCIGCCLAVGRRLYEKLGGFDPGMRMWGVEDIDFGLKAWLCGNPILHDPEAAIGHRFRATFDTYSVPMEHIIVNQLRMARKNFTDSTWEEWAGRCRDRQPGWLWDLAWQTFENNREDVERERQRLQALRVRDEFWYAGRFGLDWPRAQSRLDIPLEVA